MHWAVRLFAAVLVLNACGAPLASTIPPAASPAALPSPTPTLAAAPTMTLELDPPVASAVDTPVKMIVTAPPGTQIECSVTSVPPPPAVTITMNDSGRAVCRQIAFSKGFAGQTITFVARVPGEQPFGTVAIDLPGTVAVATQPPPSTVAAPPVSSGLPKRSIAVDKPVVHMDELFSIRIYGFPTGTTAQVAIGPAGNVVPVTAYTFGGSPGIFTTYFSREHADYWKFGTPYLHTFTFADGTVLTVPVTVIR